MRARRRPRGKATAVTGFVEGRVRARHDWAPGLVTLTIEARAEPFTPGQFLSLGLEVAQTRLFRSYSVASAPGAPLEFLLTEVGGGQLSPALIRAEPGTTVLVEPKPQGFFTLDWVPDAEELWMVATGTGLAPFLSMLRAGVALARFPRVVVVHGVREARHLAHAEELRALSRATEGRVRVVPIVSRDPDPGDALRGRVTSALADGSLEARAGLELSPARSHVLLCGNPAMIAEMQAALAARGLVRHRVRRPGHVSAEKYWD